LLKKDDQDDHLVWDFKQRQIAQSFAKNQPSENELSCLVGLIDSAKLKRLEELQSDKVALSELRALL
jgi:hypothetical protein